MFIKIQPSSLNTSGIYTVAGIIANGVNIGPTLTAAFNQANTGGGGSSLTTTIVTDTTQTAVKDTQYVLANTFATTVTLPSTPTLGDTLYIVVANNLSNNVIDRNGTKLMGIDENMTIDIANTAIGLVYVNTTLGWRLI